MRTITGPVDEHRRLIIDVAVQPAQMIVPDVQPVAFAPVTSASALRGLIDTGAQVTCITRAAARKIGLKSRGKQRLGSVSGIELHNQFRFVAGALYDDAGTRGYYWFDEVIGVDFQDNDDFDVLIGMDIITQGDLTVGRDRIFTWRLP